MLNKLHFRPFSVIGTLLAFGMTSSSALSCENAAACLVHGPKETESSDGGGRGLWRVLESPEYMGSGKRLIGCLSRNTTIAFEPPDEAQEGSLRRLDGSSKCDFTWSQLNYETIEISFRGSPLERVQIISAEYVARNANMGCLRLLKDRSERVQRMFDLQLMMHRPGNPGGDDLVVCLSWIDE